MTHTKKVWDEGSKKIPSGPNGPLGIFLMFFANHFFLKVGNLSSETVCFPSSGVNLGSTFPVNFLKTAEEKQTPLVPSVALLEIRIILKNEPNRYIFRGVIANIRYRTK